MTGFSADWLALREPIDERSRSRVLLPRLDGPYSLIVDLGAGTGANLRWLAPRLGFDQQWLLVDDDPGLLEAAVAATRDWAVGRGGVVSTDASGLRIEGPEFACTVSTRVLDLSHDLSRLEVPAKSLVTASALLDLVSEGWLEQLIAVVASTGASVHWALSYSGSVTLDPAHASDTAVFERFNLHQRTDKGFGPALGPDAHAVACGLLERAGFEVADADSSWHCGPADGRLMQALTDGWAEAAREVSSAAGGEIESWRRDRSRQAAAGGLRVTVSHRDLVAVPGNTRG